MRVRKREKKGGGKGEYGKEKRKYVNGRKKGKRERKMGKGKKWKRKKGHFQSSKSSKLFSVLVFRVESVLIH